MLLSFFLSFSLSLDPRVVPDALQRDAVLRLRHEHLLQQVGAGLAFQPVRQWSVASAQDVPQGARDVPRVVRVLEGVRPNDHQVQGRAHRPHVRRARVVGPLGPKIPRKVHQLRRHVVRRAHAERVRARQVLAQPEVDHLERVRPLVHHAVLRLEVAVAQVGLVQFGHAVHELHEVRPRQLLGKLPSILVDDLEQVAPPDELQDQNQTVPLQDHVVQGDHVLVVDLLGVHDLPLQPVQRRRGGLGQIVAL
mmetsp:Transcript_2532/g.8624  ORF Transcript_2532/g.8624 Transcript_2532/m.8624 type:complete len:250 (-) Transcript_2532:227-976(-)